MQTFETITDARNAIMDFRADHGSEIPEHLRKRFRELSASPSPVDQIVGLSELVWANREAFTDSAKQMAAGLVAFATVNAWHGLQENNRGDAMLANLRKDLDEIKTAPAAPDKMLGYYIDPDAPDPATPGAPTVQ